MKIILAILAIGLLCIAVSLVFIYTGSYDVAATVPENAVVARVLDTAMVHSVHSHAADIKPPPLDQR